MKPYIQPFERTLAVLELSQLAQATPRLACGKSLHIYTVCTTVPAELIAEHAAYWEVVGKVDRILTTRQVKREATVKLARNGRTLSDIVSLNGSVPLESPNRRCLRYGSHGLHEYRGKFFPQLVRSLLNIADLPGHSVVGDPMCGSGTTAVESVLAGYTAQALDMNPLSVFMTRTKCDVLSIKCSTLAAGYSSLAESLRRIRPKQCLDYFESLPGNDQEYLANWFAPEVLKSLDRISCAITQCRSKRLRSFFQLCQSSILRRVSWQKEGDLRVRVEKKKAFQFREVIDLFLAETERNAKHIGAFLAREGKPLGELTVATGDMRNADSLWPKLCDVVVTSPPYATALPYLDTDRLSLCYLGLLARKQHRGLDRLMIGNREISDRTRRDLWQEFESSVAALPDEVRDLIQKIYTLNCHDPAAGFRRKNLPSLLYQYFRDMKKGLGAMSRCLKEGSNAFIIVGDNRTTAKGEVIRIPTIEFLRLIAEFEGFKTIDVVPMEMLTNREIHRRNATLSESIIWLRK